MLPVLLTATSRKLISAGKETIISFIVEWGDSGENSLFSPKRNVLKTTPWASSESEIAIMQLKLVAAMFYQIFISHQMIALQKLWKMLFISSEKLF